MSVFLRYLASLMLHMAWQRSGSKGAVPPVRLPRKGPVNLPVNLPVIGPWQMMIAMWMMKRLWKRYGDDVRTHLMTHDNALANRVGAYLPTGAPDASLNPTIPATPATVNVPTSNSISTPAIAAPTASAITHDTKPLPTRRLPQNSQGATQNTTSNSTSALAKPGSILSRLRGAKQSG